MPYKDISELSDKVKNYLPEHAQEIYKEVFNNAFEEYKSSKDRDNDSSREETVHKVAWAAVKHKYQKDEMTGNWKLKG